MNGLADCSGAIFFFCAEIVKKKAAEKAHVNDARLVLENAFLQHEECSQ